MDRATRLIIHNQLEILKYLNPPQAKHYNVQQIAVELGYTSRYSEVFGVISEEEADPDMQSEVFETLDMFRALDIAKQGGWVPSDPLRAAFRGFDGNNDAHHFFAGYLLDDAGMYTESAPNKNSHSTTYAPQYRRMATVWRSVGDKYHLTDAEAEAIINA